MRHLVSPLCVLCVVFVAGCFRSDGPDPLADGGPDVPLDARPFDGLGFDAPPPVDAGPDSIGDAGFVDIAIEPPSCAPAAVSVIECPMFVCDEPARWYWNGHDCTPIECGGCEGPDCDTGSFERAECEAAHADCDPSLCRNSGGTWRFWGRADCGFICGLASGDDCADGPTCDCGADATFVPGVGCSEPCPELPTPEPEVLCRRTGGEWGGFCAHSHCGMRSPLACVGPACHCDWPQVFDERRGCVEADACFRGDGGCDERSICPTGTACSPDGQCDFLVCPF